MHAVTEDELEPGYDWQQLNNELNPSFRIRPVAALLHWPDAPQPMGSFLKTARTTKLSTESFVRRLNTRLRLLMPNLRRKIVMYAPLLALVVFIVIGDIQPTQSITCQNRHAARDGIIKRVITTAPENAYMSGDVRDLHEIQTLAAHLRKPDFSEQEIGSCINAVVFGRFPPIHITTRHSTSPYRPTRAAGGGRSSACRGPTTERHEFT